MIQKKYLQFNDLVIDSYSMLDSYDVSTSFKVETQEYSFSHGSYIRFRNGNPYAQESDISITLLIDIKKLSCDQVQYYRDYINYNLTRPGKLWAVAGNTLMYAYAVITDQNETYSESTQRLSIDVDLKLYEGVWHKADMFSTYLRPFDLCNFLECEDPVDMQDCSNYCINCNCMPENGEDSCIECDCTCSLECNDVNLCDIRQQALDAFYTKCGDNYKIIYNCKAAYDNYGVESLGTKICKKDYCDSVIAGRFQSDTVLETDGVTITIIGYVKDPYITINGNSMQVLGKYDGILTINGDLEVHFREDDCCTDELVDIKNIKIPPGSTYGFTVRRGYNTITIETNNCCRMACAYIKVDAITI